MPYKNKKDQKAYAKQYRKDHLEKRKAYDKKYHKDHREERKAYHKQYRKDHREEKKAYDKKYRKDHREEITAYHKQYNKDHRKERTAYHKQYRKTHLKERNAYTNQYNKDHRKERDTYYKKKVSIKRIKEKLEIGNMCACCGLKDIFNLTIDHIISKSMKRKFKKYKNFDIEKTSNIQLLCWACNTSKNGHKKHCTLQHDNPEIKKMVTKARRRKSKK